MKPISLPNYDELGLALDKTALKMNASQAHGIICGLLTSTKPSVTAWEALVCGNKEPAKAHALLQELYDTSAKQLEEFLFEFELLLPDDEGSLPERAECLALWCQGYLTGLKWADIKVEGREPSDVTEAITDLVEIAKMNYESVMSSDEDEAAYTELVEYVRMAVILIYQDAREQSSPMSVGKTSTQLH